MADNNKGPELELVTDIEAVRARQNKNPKKWLNELKKDGVIAEQDGRLMINVEMLAKKDLPQDDPRIKALNDLISEMQGKGEKISIMVDSPNSSRLRQARVEFSDSAEKGESPIANISVGGKDLSLPFNNMQSFSVVFVELDGAGKPKNGDGKVKIVAEAESGAEAQKIQASGQATPIIPAIGEVPPKPVMSYADGLAMTPALAENNALLARLGELQLPSYDIARFNEGQKKLQELGAVAQDKDGNLLINLEKIKDKLKPLGMHDPFGYGQKPEIFALEQLIKATEKGGKKTFLAVEPQDTVATRDFKNGSRPDKAVLHFHGNPSKIVSHFELSGKDVKEVDGRNVDQVALPSNIKISGIAFVKKDEQGRIAEVRDTAEKSAAASEMAVKLAKQDYDQQKLKDAAKDAAAAAKSVVLPAPEKNPEPPTPVVAAKPAAPPMPVKTEPQQRPGPVKRVINWMKRPFGRKNSNPQPVPVAQAETAAPSAEPPRNVAAALERAATEPARFQTAEASREDTGNMSPPSTQVVLAETPGRSGGMNM